MVKFYLAPGVRSRKFYLAPGMRNGKIYLASNDSFEKFYLAVKGLTCHPTKQRYCLSFHQPFSPEAIEEWANRISIIRGLAVVKSLSFLIVQQSWNPLVRDWSCIMKLNMYTVTHYYYLIIWLLLVRVRVLRIEKFIVCIVQLLECTRCSWDHLMLILQD